MSFRIYGGIAGHTDPALEQLDRSDPALADDDRTFSPAIGEGAVRYLIPEMRERIRNLEAEVIDLTDRLARSEAARMELTQR